MWGVLFRPVHRCERCKMQYAWRYTQCPHCSGLNDEELVWFNQRREQELNEIAGLGRVFLLLTMVVLFITIVVAAS